jgi:hypothetical protein
MFFFKASIAENITLISLKLLKSKMSLNVSESCSKNHAYHVEECERLQKYKTFEVDGMERIKFKFNKDITLEQGPQFIKMTLFAKSLHSNENLIKIIRFINDTNENCDIFMSKNSYEIFCKYQHQKQSINTNELLIQTNMRSAINVSLCQLDLGIFEDKCGEPEIPIGSLLEVNHNFTKLKFSCIPPLERSGNENYECLYGRWTPIENHLFSKCIHHQNDLVEFD